MGMFLAIEGCIGSGKSTTARQIAKKLKWPVLHENATSHPFVDDFYADPDRYAPETELVFALIHYHQLHQVDPRTNFVSDFSPAKDLIFARMNLKGDDLALFEYLYARLVRRVRKPTLSIFLDVNIEELMRRIKKRGRPYEQSIPVSYIRRLRDFYRRNLHVLGETVRIVEVRAGESQKEVREKVWAEAAASLRLSP